MVRIVKMKNICFFTVLILLISCNGIRECKLTPCQKEFYKYFNSQSDCKKIDIIDSIYMNNYHDNDCQLEQGHYNLYFYILDYMYKRTGFGAQVAIGYEAFGEPSLYNSTIPMFSDDSFLDTTINTWKRICGCDTLEKKQNK